MIYGSAWEFFVLGALIASLYFLILWRRSQEK